MRFEKDWDPRGFEVKIRSRSVPGGLVLDHDGCWTASGSRAQDTLPLLRICMWTVFCVSHSVSELTVPQYASSAGGT